jgi:hypothetical protein
VGGTSPLAIDNFVKVIRIADIGGSQISLSSPARGAVHCNGAGANLWMLGRGAPLVSRVCVAETIPAQAGPRTRGLEGASCGYTTMSPARRPARRSSRSDPGGSLHPSAVRRFGYADRTLGQASRRRTEKRGRTSKSRRRRDVRASRRHRRMTSRVAKQATGLLHLTARNIT